MRTYLARLAILGAFLTGTAPALWAQNPDTCGVNAECTGPEVGQYVYLTGSEPIIPSSVQYGTESQAITYDVNAVLANYQACTANPENPPWQPVPAGGPTGDVNIGDPNAVHQSTGDYWSLSFTWYTEYKQTKWTTRIKGTRATNSVPPCGSNYWLAPGMLRTRSVVCPSGFQSNNYTAPFDAYCYRPLGQPQPRKNLGPSTDCDLSVGHPVNVSSGNKFLSDRDYIGSGQFPLEYRRYYNSQAWTTSQTPPVGPNYFIALPNWRGTYDRAVLGTNGASNPTAFVYREDGRVLRFWNNGSSWISDTDVVERLQQSLDGSGAPAGWTLTTPDDEIETYDVDGHLLQIRSRTGVTQTLTYDEKSRPVTVTHSDGQQLTIAYDTSNRPQSITLPGGGTIVYGFGANGNLTTVTYPDTRVRTYQYNDSFRVHALTSILDENSAVHASYTYDSSGRAASSELAGGADHFGFSYPSATRTTVTDAFGVARDYDFTTIQGTRRGTALSQLCLGCGVSSSKSKSYDVNGNITRRSDFNDNFSCYAFDLTRNLETVRVEGFAAAVGNCPAALASYVPTPGTRERKITTTWHPSFRVPTSITEANRTTTYTHDSNGNVLTRTVTDTSVMPNVSRIWTYTYNSRGQVLTEDGPRTDVTDVTTYAYHTCTTGSQCGQLNTITNAAGHVTTFNAYNAHGQPTQITDANGLMMAIGYDARQRVIDRCVGATLPACTGGELTHLDYWPTGLLKRVTSPDASFIEYTYDNAHRLTQLTDGAGNKIVYTLDAQGNRTAENTYDPSLALKRTHSRVFNTLNQLWKDVNAAGTANVTTVFGYDNQGNQTTTNAPLGRNRTNAYDEVNRLKQITDPASGNMLFGYDANDNLTSVTDPRSLVTSYTYTGFGDLKTQASPDTGTTTNTYDTGGNLKTSTDARNAITTYSIDALNRVTSAAYKIGTTTDQTITYAYDAGTNQKGRLTGASDANHSLTWAYDAKGRVTSKRQVVGTFDKTVVYGYNVQGQLTSITLPSGRTIQYGYNTNNQVASVTLAGSPAVTILNAITYDPFGPVTGWTWGNGTTSTRTFDTDGKLTTVSSTASVVGNRTFGYDDAFRITSTTDSVIGGPSWTLGYDLLDRLTSATKSGATIGYTYDANGNRLTQTGTSASTYTVPGTANRLSSISGALVRSYTYNNSGSVLTSGATTHTYYNSGRMKTGKLGSAAATTYVYNALGQRVKKSGGAATTTLFMYDEAGHLIGEYSSTNTLVQETVWIGDIPVATLRPNGANVDVFYVHTDQLNTPRKITNNAPMPILRWQWNPNPFGEGAPTEPAGAFKYNLRFPGQYFDVETNLSYNYFRDYDQAIGRYVESDPVGLRGGANLFAYANNSPISGVDPLGLFQLATSQAWTTVKEFPKLPEGGIFGETFAYIRDVQCTCERFGKCWKLSGCRASLAIYVQILGGITAPQDRFTRHSEQQHVDDYLSGDGEDIFNEWGKMREEAEKKLTFCSQSECELHARNAMNRTLQNALDLVKKHSAERYDRGRHTWFPHYNLAPPY